MGGTRCAKGEVRRKFCVRVMKARRVRTPWEHRATAVSTRRQRQLCQILPGEGRKGTRTKLIQTWIMRFVRKRCSALPSGGNMCG